MELSGQLHAPDTLTLGKNPGTHGRGGWVNLRGSLGDLEKKKISWPRWDSNPGSSSK